MFQISAEKSNRIFVQSNCYRRNMGTTLVKLNQDGSISKLYINTRNNTGIDAFVCNFMHNLHELAIVGSQAE